MPGLLRGIARTAVIAGTATSVSNRVSRRQAGRWAAKEQQQQPTYAAPPPAYAAPPPQQVYVAPPAPAPADSMDDKLAQLKQLGELKAQGLLSEAEFEVQKRRILG
ncbi:SHOCT domain-containing protein [Actinoplanes sp. NPDC049668]|uniref:SHOCT domain-containing protein n=1 Tax=unclassified Actinoplanes TaxID=2626549 RepID=UPI0033BE84AC